MRDDDTAPASAAAFVRWYRPPHPESRGRAMPRCARSTRGRSWPVCSPHTGRRDDLRPRFLLRDARSGRRRRRWGVYRSRPGGLWQRPWWVALLLRCAGFSLARTLARLSVGRRCANPLRPAWSWRATAGAASRCVRARRRAARAHPPRRVRRQSARDGPGGRLRLAAGRWRRGPGGSRPGRSPAALAPRGGRARARRAARGWSAWGSLRDVSRLSASSRPNPPRAGWVERLAAAARPRGRRDAAGVASSSVRPSGRPRRAADALEGRPGRDVAQGATTGRQERPGRRQDGRKGPGGPGGRQEPPGGPPRAGARQGRGVAVCSRTAAVAGTVPLPREKGAQSVVPNSKLGPASRDETGTTGGAGRPACNGRRPPARSPAGRGTETVRRRPTRPAKRASRRAGGEARPARTGRARGRAGERHSLAGSRGWCGARSRRSGGDAACGARGAAPPPRDRTAGS